VQVCIFIDCESGRISAVMHFDCESGRIGTGMHFVYKALYSYLMQVSMLINFQRIKLLIFHWLFSHKVLLLYLYLVRLEQHHV